MRDGTINEQKEILTTGFVANFQPSPGGDLHDASRETELVPALHHTGLVVFRDLRGILRGPIDREGDVFDLRRDVEITVGSLHEIGIVVMQREVGVVILV